MTVISLRTQAHPSWVLQSHDFCVKGIGLLNLGDPDARAWISDRVDRLITTTGIDHYRQDMNFDRERCTNPSPSPFSSSDMVAS